MRPPKMSEQNDILDRLRFTGEPVADPRSTVIDGQARFTLLTARLVRLEWSASAEFEDRGTYAFPTRLAPPPDYTCRIEDDWLVITTRQLELRYRRGSGRFEAGNLRSPTPGTGTADAGRRAQPDPLNLRGTRRTLDECEGDAALEPGLMSRAGWFLFDDSRSVVFNHDDGWVAPRPDWELQDWYFGCYGHDYKGALAEYLRFGGRVPLIPRFVLGAWWSRYWAYSAQDLEDLVTDFERHDLPLDVLVVDMDWHTPVTWTGYTWNRNCSPTRTASWPHPCQGAAGNVQPAPGPGCRARTKRSTRSSPKPHRHRPGFGQAVPFHITDKRFVQNYFELLHHPMERQGVDFWWIDWQQGERTEMQGLDPLLAQPPALHRLGASWQTRPCFTAAGAAWATTATRSASPATPSSAGRRCTSSPTSPPPRPTSATAGGATTSAGTWAAAPSPSCTPAGCSSAPSAPACACIRPRTRAANAAPGPSPSRHSRPPERLPPALPAGPVHLYPRARRCRHRCGPLPANVLRVPRGRRAYAARYQYFFGPDIIAAPIVFPADPASGLAGTDVWVPPGTWIDWQTGETFTGPRWVRLVGDIERIPMLVRAGRDHPPIGAFPRRTAVDGGPSTRLASGTTDALPKDRLVLSVFPGVGSTRLYEDDGISERYRANGSGDAECEWTGIAAALDGERWQVSIAPVEGRCPALPDRTQLRDPPGRQPAAAHGADRRRRDHELAATTPTGPNHHRRAGARQALPDNGGGDRDAVRLSALGPALQPATCSWRTRGGCWART